MDNFEINLANQLQPKKIETVTLDRIIKFYEFAESNNWSANICYYEGKIQTFINTRGNGRTVYDGIGDTISEALDDLLNQMRG